MQLLDIHSWYFSKRLWVSIKLPNPIHWTAALSWKSCQHGGRCLVFQRKVSSETELWWAKTTSQKKTFFLKTLQLLSGCGENKLTKHTVQVLEGGKATESSLTLSADKPKGRHSHHLIPLGIPPLYFRRIWTDQFMLLKSTVPSTWYYSISLSSFHQLPTFYMNDA